MMGSSWRNGGIVQGLILTDVEMIIIQACVDIHKCNLVGESVPYELGRITALETFVEIGFQSWAMWPEVEDVIEKLLNAERRKYCQENSWTFSHRIGSCGCP